MLWKARRSLSGFVVQQLLPPRAEQWRVLASWSRSSTSSSSIHAIQTIRNVGVVAHIDAGKTTTTEQMLFLCGETKAVGRVDTGDTVMDFLPQERERGITISSAAISFIWKDKNINLIDTPGHVDFTVEVERSARVLDGAVVIVDAVAGVQAQTRTVWKQTRKQHIPAIAFVNKMDRDGASFENAIDTIRKKLGANAVAIQLPIGAESGFAGLVDLLSMTQLVFDPDTVASRAPGPPRIERIPTDSNLYHQAMNARKAMVESIAEVDEELMEKYLAVAEDEEKNGVSEATSATAKIPAADLIPAIRRACLRGDLVPTICGASLKCKGVEPLLDSVVAFLPSPLDRPPSVAVSKKVPEKKVLITATASELCALAFKVVHDPARGPLVYVRVYAGTLAAKQSLFNSTRGGRERINQLLRVSADDLAPVATVGAGGVACLVGLKGTITGDTLVAEKGPLQGFVLDGLTLPRAVFSLAIEPETSSQQADMDAALAILCMEDPSLRVEQDKESGQTVLRGIGELHLEIVCDKLRRQFGVEVQTGRVYVNYRESISVDEGPLLGQRHVYDRTLGTKRMFAAMTFDVTPDGGEEEPTVEISLEAKQAATADEYSAMADGLKAAFSRGPQGFPVAGMHVKVAGLERDADTGPGAVRACVAGFVDTLLRSSRQIVLEPVMAVEVDLPAACLGDALSDLTVKRRGQVKEVNAPREGGVHNSTIFAEVPLATMLGYATAIRSMTGGEGAFSMEYLCHRPVDQYMVDEFMTGGGGGGG